MHHLISPSPLLIHFPAIVFPHLEISQVSPSSLSSHASMNSSLPSPLPPPPSSSSSSSSSSNPPPPLSGMHHLISPSPLLMHFPVIVFPHLETSQVSPFSLSSHASMNSSLPPFPPFPPLPPPP